ncbi:GNAT family N-acetyltransferase [Roseomonas marmotae]|uniref:N-acetyltransferase family protein n=1 Tax=Roseomonas marmotae TaxID=2768161 RepID=A0ABS3K9R2_9PROT|nr:GNAT family N-acetyltransferase [Roseomonas marmotae]MBO1074200.1 N-acetyltransferase family protein [Roseomonas marmotae]QTI78970.1 N-acetyltransferase family protein [Roseomonas marmotae]
MTLLPHTSDGWILRLAEEADLPGILVIQNDVIANTTAIYTDAPETLEQRAAWMEQRRARGFPILVAACPRTGAVLGFASFGDFRPGWFGYRHTVEHSVHVHADARGRGIGQTLVAALLEEARSLGKHVMVAAVDAANEPSLRMHEKLGFSRVALMPQVGCKFGRWLDLVLLQLVLQEGPPL